MKALARGRRILRWKDATRRLCFRDCICQLANVLQSEKIYKTWIRVSSWSHFGECENAHGVSLSTGRTVSEASSYFRRSYLSFQQGALCTTPQRLMKSLELVSLGEEVESNRNTSCALLITTLITSVKMSIAAALCCAGATEPYIRTLPEPGRCTFIGLPYHLLPPVLCERTHTHTHTGYVTRQQSDSSHLFILWYISVQIRFSDPFQKKPMNLWADDSQELEWGWRWGGYSEYTAMMIQSLTQA